MMGEAYHNNHHKYGSRPNFGGIRWHEIDVTYLIMVLLDKIGLIKLKEQQFQCIAKFNFFKKLPFLH
jgi:fatty-acid desaturase